MTWFYRKNQLQHQLIAAREGWIPPEDFIETLSGSEVFMPTFATHAVAGLKTDCRALPFKLVG